MIYNLQVSFLSLLNSTPILDSNTNTELEKKTIIKYIPIITKVILFI